MSTMLHHRIDICVCKSAAEITKIRDTTLRCGASAVQEHYLTASVVQLNSHSGKVSWSHSLNITKTEDSQIRHNINK